MKIINIGLFGGDAETRKALMNSLCKIHMNKEVNFVCCEKHEVMKQWEPLRESEIPKVKKNNINLFKGNSWRGGSRGKGGKTKWPRR